ncbi:TadE/TadG family type IV pilus assembly protein [Trinickia dinghuensis]|uniref:Pilus assembly protein n=1 Tax=Trinickia dinghuensis TaxID=2291023 RepID=A0A3D8JXJ7_9BURK|nr:TadE/TadG family type IV pilus assembly protein [Trinickia dinghuensis]RDU97366.1 pilus assembly protein [Trinickia dinghuensis]
MKRSGRPPRKRARSAGNAAVEFALVFPLLFLVLYGIVTYSVLFVAQQSLTLAAEEGARAALNYQSAASVAGALSARSSNACNVANQSAGWLGAYAQCAAQAQNCSYDGAMSCVQVTLTYDYAAHPIVPTLPLLSLALPQTLSSVATVQLDPENLL